MIVIQFATHRARRTCRQHVQHPSWVGQSKCINLSMTSRQPRHEAVASRSDRLQATWSRNSATGALECRWGIQPPDDVPRKTMPMRRVNGERARRVGKRAAVRPPPVQTYGGL
jgi:hypothetical protein